MMYALTLAAVMLLGVGVVSASEVTPSTNDENKDMGWAHFNVVDVDVGSATIEFVSTRSFLSCFEYRTDGDTTQKISDTNHNTDITDGLYPFVCVNNNEQLETLNASEYVEIRMVFGAERDERFDWTRVDVLAAPGEILSPSAGEEIVYGQDLHLLAMDVGAKHAGVQWAVREGTCNQNQGTVAGNVDGYNTPYAWNEGEFSSTVSTHGLNTGEYCFVFNPRSGDRLTQLFSIIQNVPMDKDECKRGGYKEFTEPAFRNQGQCVSYVQANEQAGKR